MAACPASHATSHSPTGDRARPWQSGACSWTSECGKGALKGSSCGRASPPCRRSGIGADWSISGRRGSDRSRTATLPDR
eukprot:5276863-Prymnesium_polylepis.1